jgi:two-component system OmpR family sensor kinase
MAIQNPHWYQRLYWRIWLTVLALVLVLAGGIAALWRVDIDRDRSDRTSRELVVRGPDGAVVGEAKFRRPRPHEREDSSDDDHHQGSAHHMRPAPFFELTLTDGRQLSIELSPFARGDARPTGVDLWRTLMRWLAQPTGWIALLLTLTALVALMAYPVVRRLTARLERLQRGVEAWGEGDLSTRLPTDGHDEVAFLARQFNRSAARVEAAAVARKALLANASHELRSPLARIKMSLALLPPVSDGGGRAAHDEITQSIDELDALIGEILLASRLDHDPQSIGIPVPVDLSGLLGIECARLGLEPEMESGVLVKGNEALLVRLIRNLLENAIRHGRQQKNDKVGDAAPRVGVTLARDLAKGQVVLRVADNGPGVPMAYRERIFEPFFRLPGASERDGGVGLGLALVKTIAHAHGASVACVEPPTGRGATFEVVWSI